MDLKEAAILGSDVESHWYYQSKVRSVELLTKHLSPRAILDVGAGSGFFSRSLLRRTSAAEAYCVDISYPPGTSDTEEKGKPVYFRTSIGPINADLVLLMDVLEHVDDDVGLLKEYIAKVPQGSTFLITVPAFKFLWSQHDEFLEHKRRYTVAQLEKVVQDAGLQVRRAGYFFGFVLPLAASIRLLERVLPRRRQEPQSQLRSHGALTNACLRTICRLELGLVRFNRLAGLTVYCLATK